jgi:hypothetical protein
MDSPLVAKVTNAAQGAADKVLDVLGTVKPYVHYGFVPLVVFLGMRTEPRPSVWQLISPM